MDLHFVIWDALNSWRAAVSCGVPVLVLLLLLVNLRLNSELFLTMLGLTGLIAGAMWHLGYFD